jgi:hypothetical protein
MSEAAAAGGAAAAPAAASAWALQAAAAAGRWCRSCACHRPSARAQQRRVSLRALWACVSCRRTAAWVEGPSGRCPGLSRAACCRRCVPWRGAACSGLECPRARCCWPPARCRPCGCCGGRAPGCRCLAGGPTGTSAWPAGGAMARRPGARRPGERGACMQAQSGKRHTCTRFPAALSQLRAPYCQCHRRSNSSSQNSRCTRRCCAAGCRTRTTRAPTRCGCQT